MTMFDAVTSALLPFAIAWFILLMSLRTAVVLRRGYKVELGMAKGHLESLEELSVDRCQVL